MSQNFPITLKLVVAGAVLATVSWYFLKSNTPAPSELERPAKVSNASSSSTRLLNSGVYVDSALKRATGQTLNRAAAVPLKSAAAIEFEKGLNLKQFYDRYASNPQGADAETKFFAAAALETCQWKARNQQPTDVANQRFLSRLKENDPNNDQRIDAYNKTNAACDGFQNLNLNATDVSRLYAEAAAAGNPAAKAAVAADLYRDQSRNAKGVEERRMTEEQLGLVRDALASGDPFAIRRAGQLLSYESTQLTDRKLGPEGDPFNARDFGPAFTFLACDHGANCGADANRVLQGCANQGACGYTSLQNYMQFNELSPNAYANAQRYNAMIADAITQGRWDLLGIAPGSGRTVTPTPPAAPTPSTPSAPSAPSAKPTVPGAALPPATKPVR